MPTIDLKGLKGLKGLSVEERQAWREANSSKIKGMTYSDRDRLYRNQQFVQRFNDMDLFYSMTPEDRDTYYASSLADEAI